MAAAADSSRRLRVYCWNVAYWSYSSYILARTITVTYPTSPTVGTLQMQYTDDRCNITVTYIHLYVSVVCISVLYGVCVPARSCGWRVESNLVS